MPLATVAEQPRFVRRFTAAHERARAWAATPLGTAGPGFSARYGRVEDTPLLDFINEMQRRRAGADLSAAADFDLGAGLPEGEVRERDVSGVTPTRTRCARSASPGASSGPISSSRPAISARINQAGR